MRMDRRRFLLGSSGLTGLALLAAACGGGASPTTAPAKAGATAATGAGQAVGTTAAGAGTAVAKPAGTAAAAAGTTVAGAGTAAATTATGAAPVTPTTAAGAATKPAAATGGAGQKVVFWGAFGGNLGKSMEELVDRYNKQAQGIAVEHQFQGSYEDTANKLTAALAAKQTPETVVLSDVWWFKFYLNSSLAQLDDLMATAKVDKGDYVDSLINEGIKEGKTWWIPFARSTPLFYYNKDMLQAAGLPDRGPKNWDEFTEWAPKLVKKEGDTIKTAAINFVGGASYVAWIFQGMIWQWGGKYSNEITDPDFKIMLADPPGVEAGQFIQDLIYKQKVAINSKDAQVDFVNGLSATTMLSTGSLAGVTSGVAGKFQFGTAFLPEQKQFGCCTGGAGLGIMQAAAPEKKTATMDFIKFATAPDQQVIWSQQTGYMPVRKSSVASGEMKAYFDKNPNAKVAVEQLPKTQPQDAARVFIPNGDQIIGKGLEKIMLAQEAPATAFKATADELTREARPVLAAVKARKP